MTPPRIICHQHTRCERRVKMLPVWSWGWWIQLWERKNWNSWENQNRRESSLLVDSFFCESSLLWIIPPCRHQVQKSGWKYRKVPESTEKCLKVQKSDWKSRKRISEQQIFRWILAQKSGDSLVINLSSNFFPSEPIATLPQRYADGRSVRVQYIASNIFRKLMSCNKKRLLHDKSNNLIMTLETHVCLSKVCWGVAKWDMKNIL